MGFQDLLLAQTFPFLFVGGPVQGQWVLAGPATRGRLPGLGEGRGGRLGKLRLDTHLPHPRCQGGKLRVLVG